MTRSHAMLLWGGLLGGLVGWIGSDMGRAADNKPEVGLQILVPAYFYPAGPGLKEWDRLLEAASKVPIVAIVNPASGPGKEVDANYTALLKKANKTKVRLIGYVSTSYGKRPLADVRADLERWPKLYPEIQGYFFDEQASAVAQVAHYAAIYQHARKIIPDATVISNPGTVCARDYLSRPTTQTACLFEGAGNFESMQPPEWSKDFPAGAFAALVHSTEQPSKMRQYVQQAVQRRVGFFLVTDGTGTNPWGRLPTYWDQEVVAFKQAGQRK